MVSSRVVGATLLVLVLLDSFSESAALSPGFAVTAREIRRCRCTYWSHGRKLGKCPSPLLPTDDRGKRNLIQCLCSKAKLHDPPRRWALCQVKQLLNDNLLTLM